MKYKKYTSEVAVAAFIILLFVFVGYFSRTYSEFLVDSIGSYEVLGMVVYVLGTVIAIVIAPLTFIPLLPVAVTLWGSFVTALLSILAWSIGAVIAFWLAQRYGQPIVERLVGKEKMRGFLKLLPEKHIFLAVIFLRMALPVDVVSYAIGLFNVMRFWPYVVTTVIGITPFAFIFAYLVEVNILFQIGAFSLGFFVILLGLPRARHWYKEMFTEDN